MDFIFLDGASGNPTLPDALDAINYWSKYYPYNVSSFKNYGNKIQTALNESNEFLLDYLGMKNSQSVVWNSGATESIYSILINEYINRKFDAVIINKYVHPTALKCCHKLEELGCEIIEVPSNNLGILSVKEIEKVISKLDSESHFLFYCEALNSFTGAFQDIAGIKSLLEKQEHIKLSLDITQAIGKSPLINLDWCDYIFASCHKYGGPKGIGFLVHKDKTRFLMQIDEARDGTINHVGIIASISALKQAIKINWYQELLNRINLSGLLKEMDQIYDNKYNVILLTSKNLDNFQIVRKYPNVIVGFGSACSNGIMNTPKIYANLKDQLNVKTVIRISV